MKIPRTRQEAMKRKKARGRVRKEAPLPILAASSSDDRAVTSNLPCRYFTAYLQGCSVVVQHSGDIDYLYSMGFFGKGTLSRSEPSFTTRQQRVNLPKLNKKDDDNDTVQALLVSKRKYLAHLRYKALSDDEESVYNEIVQQEQAQLSAYGEDDDENDYEEELEDEEGEEFVEEEEDNNFDYSDIQALNKYSFGEDNKGTKLTTEELNKIPRSLLVALMTQVALLSKEQIATFVRVPCSLTELQVKYQIMRARQVSVLKGLAKVRKSHSHRQSQMSSQMSTLFASLKNTVPEDSGGSGTSLSLKQTVANSSYGFGKKGIINLEEGDNEAVVVLNSDDDDEKEEDGEEEEEKEDYDDHTTEQEKSDVSKRPEDEKAAKTVAKGWDDLDDEGDADFWGMTEETEGNEKGEKENKLDEDATVVMKQSGGAGEGSCQDKTDDSGCTGQEDVKDESGSREEESSGCIKNIDGSDDEGNGRCDNKEGGGGMEKVESEDCKSITDKGGGNKIEKKISSPKADKIDPGAERIPVVSDSMTEQGEEGGALLCHGVEEKEGEKLTVSKPPNNIAVSSSLPSLSSTSSTSVTLSATTMSAPVTTPLVEDKANKVSEDDDDDDDVICVEEESAKPAKLHQYLSQAQASRSSSTVKPVTFLSSITEEPKFVSTRIGFKLWDNVLHFNFSGDHTHLPTGMAVYSDDEEVEESAGSVESTPDVDKKDSRAASVYERVYPPVRSLVASPNSKGSIMKQRNDPIPFLDLAVYNLQQRFASSNIVSPRPYSLAQAQTRHSLHPSASHGGFPSRQPHSLLNMQNENSLWSHPSLTGQQKTSAHSQSHNPSLLSSSSASSSRSTVTPSQLQLYLQVFQEKSEAESDDKDELKEKNNSSEENFECELKQLHIQLNKTGLLKMKVASTGVDNGSSLDRVSNDSQSKHSALHLFNKMLSEFMKSQHISLEQELMLLRILMYDEKSVAANAIPKELVSHLKSEISPGQVSCLLERMDYVQVCVESKRKDVLSGNEVITIDLSDDDEGEEEEEEEMIEGIIEDGVNNDEKAVASISSNDRTVSKNKNSKTNVGNNHKDGGGENVESVGVGVKRPLDLEYTSTDCSAVSNANKRLKESSSVEEDQQNEKVIEDDGNSRAFDGRGNVSGEEKLDSGGNDSGVCASTANCDDTQRNLKELDNDNSPLKEDKCKLSQSEPQATLKESANAKIPLTFNDDKCDPSQSSCGDYDKGEKVNERESDVVEDKGLLTTVSENRSSKSNNSVVSVASETTCAEDLDLIDSSMDKSSGKEESTSIRDVLVRMEMEGGATKDISGGKNNVNGSSSSRHSDHKTGSGGGDVNEIYVGSSDDDDDLVEDERIAGVGERAYRNRYRRSGKTKTSSKSFSRNGSMMLCGSDEDDGDNFVIANTSDEEVENYAEYEDGGDDGDDDVGMMNNGGWLRRANRWRPCLKRDPYPMEETLHLMLEEAFFLMFGLGCLRVLDQEMTPMTVTSLWERLVVIQEKFLPRYVAYHYFRSKGWVPKSGLKFGCDFILYREGPPFFHGSFSVVVVPVRAGTLADLSGEDGELEYSRRWTSWIALSGLNRITEHVAKELMICYVIFPKGLTEEASKSPKCLTDFKVKEVVVSRWVSAREREAKDQLEEMP